ncbi:pentatricopeptide repeat-containing protein At1g33350 [Asparagus officinalis]|nr:pentatricopeptide repeat-containing protein At1g33350 [Asparagus officinalis]
MPSSSSPTLYQRIVSLLDKSKSLTHLKQIQSSLIISGHGQNQLLSFKLVRFSALNLTDLSYARLIFDSLRSPNVFLYTAMLTAYSLHSHSSALNLFAQMLQLGKPKPNEFIYPLVLKSCSDCSDLILMKLVHTHVSKSGFDAYSVIKTSLLDSYARFSDLGTARSLFDEMPDRNVVSWTALISGYARAGKMGNAVALFEEMPERDVPSWNSMVAGFAQNGMFPEAVKMFQRMVISGARPNSTTVSCVLSACGHLGMLRLGKLVHGYVLKVQIGYSSFVSNALIDMYGKCGNVKEARWVFDTLSDKSLTAWNSMINCLALQGHSNNAIETFKAMEISGLVPDGVTFVGLLNACTHGGLVDRGLHYLESMKQDYKIEPQIEHYGCVIDLLGRAGRFKEAMEFVKDMRIEPDEVVWGSLLNGCRIHGDKNLAEFAIKKLLEMNPDNVGYGIMLANLYSESGKWEEVGKVRKMLKEGGGKKLPGCSWIEAETEFHQFHSGDKLHCESEEIHRILEVLAGVMET